jgi:glycosyltransferase involved in cell wall biosynthesis
MISIYTIAYNEELMIAYFIDWYRYRFPDCRITVFDNESTDRTKEIAESKGCKVITYCTNGKMSETMLREIKNSCWKHCDTNWALVVDVDELVDVNWVDLKLEQRKGTTIIDFQYWTVVNKTGATRLEDMNYGVHHKRLTAKRCLFNPRAIREINYEIGAHVAHPVGHIQLSQRKYKFFHYKMLSLEWLLSRFAEYRGRLTEESIKNKWGLQYSRSRVRTWWHWKRRCWQAKQFK